MTITTHPRDAAGGWIAETITKHLKPELGGADRVRRVADEIEGTAFQENMPVELAVELTAEWCDEQNGESRFNSFSAMSRSKRQNATSAVSSELSPL
jgi:hypothetical protein